MMKTKRCLHLDLYPLFLSVLFKYVAAQEESDSDKPIVAALDWVSNEQMCPSLDDRMITYVHVPWGLPGRAYFTVPPEIEIVPSRQIPKAGLGTVAKTFIHKHTWLGEYDGFTVLPQEHNYITPYAWMTRRGGVDSRYIDAGDVRTSNWLRWVNTPRTVFEENVHIKECQDKVLYITARDIYPGEELMVNYGEGYVRGLGFWKHYQYSWLVRNVGREVKSRKNSENIFKEIMKLFIPSADGTEERLHTVLLENEKTLENSIGSEFYSRLIKYVEEHDHLLK